MRPVLESLNLYLAAERAKVQIQSLAHGEVSKQIFDACMDLSTVSCASPETYWSAAIRWLMRGDEPGEVLRELGRLREYYEPRGGGE